MSRTGCEKENFIVRKVDNRSFHTFVLIEFKSKLQLFGILLNIKVIEV